jgi:hypothetical protein
MSAPPVSDNHGPAAHELDVNALMARVSKIVKHGNLMRMGLYCAAVGWLTR